MLGKSEPKLFSQVVGLDGDFYGTIRQTSPTKQIQEIKDHRLMCCYLDVPLEVRING